MDWELYAWLKRGNRRREALKTIAGSNAPLTVKEIKNKLKDKQTYLFVSNNLNPSEFENFEIESWVNTACPRLDMDASIINAEDLNLGKSENSF